MPGITYNLNIPLATNNPSVDQPNMKINTNAIDTLLQVDHVSFNTSGSGQHEQVTYNNKNPASAQTDPQSVLYTNSGTASTKADLFFRNQDGIFRPTALRAAGVVTTSNTNGAVSVDNGFNVSSVVISSNGVIYTVNLSANATTGNNAIVFVNRSNGTVPSWSFASNTLTITTTQSIGQKLNFVIYQI